VSRRIDVDAALPAVAIPGRILDELRHHARDTLPEECCGLIIGDENERYKRVVRCHNDMNQRHQDDPESFPRDAKTAFWMRETDYQQAWDSARESGEQVTAVYHSHVGVDAYLSEEDLGYAEQEFFPFPDADQIVVGVPVLEESDEPRPQLADENLKPRVAVFRREAPEARFVGHLAKEPGA
jgi:proteasome lid subunit RPN8/RPN11